MKAAIDSCSAKNDMRPARAPSTNSPCVMTCTNVDLPAFCKPIMASSISCFQNKLQ